MHEDVIKRRDMQGHYKKAGMVQKEGIIKEEGEGLYKREE